MSQRIFAAGIGSKCDEIDRERDAKNAMPPPQLADYSFELAQKVQARHRGERTGTFSSHARPSRGDAEASPAFQKIHAEFLQRSSHITTRQQADRDQLRP